MDRFITEKADSQLLCHTNYLGLTIMGNSTMKTSRKEYHKAYYFANKEKIKAHVKAYRLTNKEKIKVHRKAYRLANKEKRKAYYFANKEKIRARGKAYKLAHKEEIKTYTKAYHLANPEKKRQRNRKRKALKLGNSHEPYTDAYIFERDGWTCQLCRRKIDKRFKYPNPLSKSIDHIKALSKGGADAPINLQAAHLRCNQGKYTKGGSQLSSDDVFDGLLAKRPTLISDWLDGRKQLKTERANKKRRQDTKSL